jgi:hypothetical protein
MRSPVIFIMMVLLATIPACSIQPTPGVADKRSDFRSFLPMKADPGRDGLKRAKPYFRRADRGEIIRAIERACNGRRSGSSVYDPRTGAGYYVNCNPRNRQLLNGYVPANPSQQPHSR